MFVKNQNTQGYPNPTGGSGPSTSGGPHPKPSK